MAVGFRNEGGGEVRRGGDWREGGSGESDVSKMWEVNSASEPLTGMPAALEGSSMHTARGLCLKICSARWKLSHGVSEGQEL